MTEGTEKGTVFKSGDNRLVGVVSAPENPGEVGVLILVGGPQYRVGSHRQFTLLARSLGELGIPSLRFDYSGMGDSEGEKSEFHEIEADISAALDNFFVLIPQMSRVVLWGLCDAASAALMFCHKDSRVSGLVLLNPWVHSGDYSPETKLSHYYAPLLKGKDTWRRFFAGEIHVASAAKDFARDLCLLLKKLVVRSAGGPSNHSWVASMLAGLKTFDGKTLFLLSEKDFTAQEFQSLIANDKNWNKAVANAGAELCGIAGSDHTFSDIKWQDEVVQHTVRLVKKS